jgi:hypothetical protein
MAAVFDGANEWRSSTGTPVITSGNPLAGVVITVAQTSPSATPTPAATASPSPTAAATATAAPTATGGTSGGTSGGGIDPLILGVLALVVIGGAAVIYLMRR